MRGEEEDKESKWLAHRVGVSVLIGVSHLRLVQDLPTNCFSPLNTKKTRDAESHSLVTLVNTL